MGGIFVETNVSPRERGMVSHNGRMVHASEFLEWVGNPGDSSTVDTAEDRMIIYGYAIRMKIKIRTQKDGKVYRIWRVE